MHLLSVLFVDVLPDQAEYDAMLQEYAGEGIPLVAACVPADSFAPFLNDVLPVLLSKAVSLDSMTSTMVQQKHYLLQMVTT